jgi:hypothetical protein
MALGKWKMFGSYFRVHSSEAYKDTVRAVEHLASTSLALLDGKAEDERRLILGKAQGLTEKMFDVVETETPLVVALALMTALRAHEHLLQQQTKRVKGESRPEC